jgi:hypothetical protein
MGLFYIGVYPPKEVIKMENIKIIGAIIYACEGTKKDFNGDGYLKKRVVVVNSDVRIIEGFLRYLRTFNIDEKVLRARLFIHDNDNEESVKKYWSKITNIPKSQFIKTCCRKSSQKQKSRLKYGTLEIRYHRAKIYDSIMKDIQELLNQDF